MLWHTCQNYVLESTVTSAFSCAVLFFILLPLQVLRNLKESYGSLYLMYFSVWKNMGKISKPIKSKMFCLLIYLESMIIWSWFVCIIYFFLRGQLFFSNIYLTSLLPHHTIYVLQNNTKHYTISWFHCC